MKLMNKAIKKVLDNLPEKFHVKVTLTNLGTYLADIKELDTFTEVDSLQELDFAINDLVATYFDIPIRYYDSFRYVPLDKKPIVQPNSVLNKRREFKLFEDRAVTRFA